MIRENANKMNFMLILWADHLQMSSKSFLQQQEQNRSM